MTYLQIVNAVLRRLREGEVSSVSETAYSKLIGDFVNETKREVEDAYNWSRLRATIQVTTESDGFRYVLTDAGNRCRLLHAFNDTEDTIMHLKPQNFLTRLFNTNNSTQTGAPIYFGYNGFVGDDPAVDVWPVPDGEYQLNFDFVIPQDDFTLDTEELVVPSTPVILGAYSRALSERGEDGGQQFGEFLLAYQSALSDAIAIDSLTVPTELTWTVQ